MASGYRTWKNQKSPAVYKTAGLFLTSDPARIQTWNLLIRSQVLYSVELRGHYYFFVLRLSVQNSALLLAGEPLFWEGKYSTFSCLLIFFFNEVELFEK